MTAEQFVYWLEGYIKGAKIELSARSDISNKLDEVKKNLKDREPIQPAIWPNNNTTYPFDSNYNSTLT